MYGITSVMLFTNRNSKLQRSVYDLAMGERSRSVSL